MKGYVYVLANRALPGLVKIGFSLKDPEIRRRELSGTALPYEFALVYEALVDGPLELEQRIHSHLRNYRVTDKREFFNLSDSAALQLVKQFFDAAGVQPIYEASFVDHTPEPSKTQVKEGDCHGFEHWKGAEPFFLDCFGSPALVRDRSTTYGYVDDIHQWRPDTAEGGWTNLWIDDLSKIDYEVLCRVSCLVVEQHSPNSVELLNKLLRDPQANISMLGIPAESHPWMEDPKHRLRVLNLRVEDTASCEEIRIAGRMNCLQIYRIPKLEHVSSRLRIVIDSNLDRLCIGSEFDRHGDGSQAILISDSAKIGDLTVSEPLPPKCSSEFIRLLRRSSSASISVSTESCLPDAGQTRVRSINLSRDCDLSTNILRFIENQSSLESITGYRLTSPNIPDRIQTRLPNSLQFILNSYGTQPRIYWARDASGRFVPQEFQPYEGTIQLAARLSGRQLEVLDWLAWD